MFYLQVSLRLGRATYPTSLAIQSTQCLRSAIDLKCGSILPQTCSGPVERSGIEAWPSDRCESLHISVFSHVRHAESSVNPRPVTPAPVTVLCA